MSCNLNENHTLTTRDEAYSCLAKWSQKTHVLRCKKEGDNALSITIVREDVETTVKIKEVWGRHSFSFIYEMDSCGVPKSTSVQYSVLLEGTNTSTGAKILFNASLNTDSKDGGRTWSPSLSDAHFSDERL